MMLNHADDFLQKLNLSSFIWRYYINEFDSDWKMDATHVHNAFEIISVVNGNSAMVFDNKTEKLSTDHCLMILPNVPHRFYVKKSNTCTLINIHFNAEQTPLLGYLSHIEPTHSLNENGFIKTVGSPAIAHTMKSIVQELECKEKDYEKVVKLLFCELFVHMQRMIEETGKGGDVSKKAYVLAAKQYIEQNLAETINPDGIAETMYISAGYLMHVFKDVTGQTLMEYVLLRRLEKSKVLLCETNETITSIASKIGITNSQYFSVLFKSHYGMTPREFKKTTRLCNISDSNIFK